MSEAKIRYLEKQQNKSKHNIVCGWEVNQLICPHKNCLNSVIPQFSEQRQAFHLGSLNAAYTSGHWEYSKTHQCPGFTQGFLLLLFSILVSDFEIKDLICLKFPASVLLIKHINTGPIFL